MRLIPLLVALLLALAPRAASAGVSLLSDGLGALPFEALSPLTAAGDVLVIQEAGGQLAQLTVLAIVDGEADAVAALIADPLKHKDMSDTVAAIEVLGAEGNTTRFTAEIDTPGFNSTMIQEMQLLPGRTIRTTSTGHLVGEYLWRFTPLSDGRTGVEYTLFADMASMGAVMRWVGNRAPSLQTGSNAVAGIVTVQGLRRLVGMYLKPGSATPAPAAAGAPPAPLPPLEPLWQDPALAAALTTLASRGTVAWVGPGETLLLARLPTPPAAARQQMVAPEGQYPMRLETPFKTYDVVVLQEAEGEAALHETIADGGAVTFDWRLGFLPTPAGETAATLRSTVDLSDSFLMRLAMGVDPAVGPALRLATLLSPWARVKK